MPIKLNYTNCFTKCAKSHFANYNGKCRYIFKAALGKNRTKGAFQIVIGINQKTINHSFLFLYYFFLYIFGD